MDQFTYRLEIQRVSDGTFFPAGEVAPAHFQEAREQAIFLAQRRGVIGPDANSVALREQPVFGKEAGNLIAGVTMAVDGNGKGNIEKTYNLDLFATIAHAQAENLAKQGFLEKDGKYLYRVFADKPSSPEASLRASGVSGGVVAKVQRKPLPLRPGKLADWLCVARPVGPLQDGDFPLFITDRALDLSKEYSRAPGDKEGGALMMGGLYQQLEPEPEIFAVIDDALEARHAKQDTLSLDLTAETWKFFEAQFALRRTRMGKVHELPLAFGHGHNFLPSVKEDDGKRCGECHLRASCPYSSSFYSTKDTEFHRAWFGRQPYVVGLVWGYTTKKEDDLKVFTLDGTQPRRRGFYQIAKALP